MITDDATLKQIVKFVLENHHSFQWKAHGLGFLRLYFSDTLRLHVWHDKLKWPVDATPLHDHPWHLSSLVVAGKVENHRFVINKEESDHTHVKQLLQCGAGGCLMEESEKVHLTALKPEEIYPGDHYEQFKREIHQTIALNGTVTIMERIFDGNRDHAHVYIPKGFEFVSADFRFGLDDVIDEVCADTLQHWF